ncbi:hypothetical protein Anas_13308 [Armadillidium nasatum]|uniref:Uncharacterized protein n=1 Tax=Armadillidium nasatum TaxID=96803 RepID=A0A5N5T8C5_9CRUS|nr:hypothetical protein Anas_13308 [Armadillidium nasatum]
MAEDLNFLQLFFFQIFLVGFIFFLYLGIDDDKTGYKGVSLSILLSVAVSISFLALNPEPEYIGMIPVEILILLITITAYNFISIETVSKFNLDKEVKLANYDQPNETTRILEMYQNLTMKKGIPTFNDIKDLINHEEDFKSLIAFLNYSGDFSKLTDAPFNNPSEAIKPPTPSIHYFLFLILVFLSEIPVIFQMLTVVAVFCRVIFHLKIKIALLERESYQTSAEGLPDADSYLSDVFDSESGLLIPASPINDI